MGWLKHVIIDLAVTVVIVIAAVTGAVWAQWVVWIYTPFMLLLKLVGVFGAGVTAQFKRAGAEVPTWFYHALYAVNVGVLLVYGWWLVGAGWGLIWILSVAAEMRARRTVGKPKKASR
jgi:hypothetical protein